uniref:Uncharacterized protein n=1 Tax=Datura stramonium TaxID=4076 RepID=A0ABS8TE70_DATST|nr:hypothetical protein [Datura stramonium]
MKSYSSNYLLGLDSLSSSFSKVMEKALSTEDTAEEKSSRNSRKAKSFYYQAFELANLMYLKAKHIKSFVGTAHFANRVKLATPIDSEVGTWIITAVS